MHVETIRLDDLIANEHVDFPKIDIEGVETDAICSSRKLDQGSQIFDEYHSFIEAPQRPSLLLTTPEKAGFRYSINRIYAPSNPYLEITTNHPWICS